MTWYIEADVPGVLYNGLNTAKAVDFSGASSITFGSKSLTVGAIVSSGAISGTTITGTGALSGITTISASGAASLVTGTATTAGGVVGINFGTSSAVSFTWGSGVPTLSAGKGSLYLRTDGIDGTSRLYVNTDGSTTWQYFTANG